jgi:hypothetical protein
MIVGISAGLLSGCTASTPPEAVTPMAQAPKANASQALAALFRQSDEATLRRNPTEATARGDLRYAGRLGDFFSDAYYDAEREAARADLAALAAIDRNALAPTSGSPSTSSNGSAAWICAGSRASFSPPARSARIDHFNGFHTAFAELSSGQGIAPYKTVRIMRTASPGSTISSACRQRGRPHGAGAGGGRRSAQAGHGQRPRAARRDAGGGGGRQQLHTAP